MSAKASGASPQNGSADKRRDHHDGSSGRAFTEDQKVAVVRIRKCSPTAFYDILGIESEKKTVDDAGIKKAYRKQSLLTHPDKNGYEGADEAFKMISRAFQVLSDPDKKRSFDQYGVDPDNRFSASQASNPFSGFSRSAGGGGRSGPMFEEEISPEELFRQFFGGGFGGGFGSPFGGGLFDTGPGFVFNVGGGGPGVRVHQFGGPRVRRRPPGTGAPNANEPPRTAWGALQQLLPLLILFIIPILSSLFSGSSTTSASRYPTFHINEPALRTGQPAAVLSLHHDSANLRIPYYVNPSDVEEYTARKWRKLDDVVENTLMQRLSSQCDHEYRVRENLFEDARGWFFPDQEKMEQARRMEMPACTRLKGLSGGRI